MFCIVPSTTCLVSLFVIVTGNAGVPARDVISTQKTHVPIVVVFVGVWCGVCSTVHIGCWSRSSIRWWFCGRWSVVLSSFACPATSSSTASAPLSTTTSGCGVWCWLIIFWQNRRVRCWCIRDRCTGRLRRWYVLVGWCLYMWLRWWVRRWVTSWCFCENC